MADYNWQICGGARTWWWWWWWLSRREDEKGSSTRKHWRKRSRHAAHCSHVGEALAFFFPTEGCRRLKRAPQGRVKKKKTSSQPTSTYLRAPAFEHKWIWTDCAVFTAGWAKSMIFCSGVWQRCCGVPPLWSVKCCCNISTIWEWLRAPSLSPICLPRFLCSFTTIFSSHLNILNPVPGCAYKQNLSRIKSRPNELFL